MRLTPLLVAVLVVLSPLAHAAEPETTAAPQDHPDLVRFAASRAALASYPHRPLYHFSTPESLLNDPNGLCQWRGNYHLFYQLGRDGKMHWGHAVSPDLVHWRDLPIALAPTIEDQCYSGQTLVEDDRVIAMYHGTKVGNMIATASDDLLLDWTKLPENPVIPIVKTDNGGNPYRVFDPCIWKEDDGYYALSGTYRNGARGRDAEMVEHLFRSTDLKTWEYLGPMVTGYPFTERGEDGAVPNFWPIGNGKHLLVFFSHKRAAQYLVGDYDQTTHTFHPQTHGRFNFGPWIMGSLHAPAACLDTAGRYLAIFNVRENISAVKAGQPGYWYGMMTLPRRLWLDDHDQLRMEPVPELATLRFDPAHVDAMTIPANGEVVLDTVRGKAIEIDATFEPGSAREFGLHVLRSPDGRERTTITLYMSAGGKLDRQIGIDVSQASLSPHVKSRSPEIAPLSFPDGEPVRLRVFVDRSIVEVFVNDTQCATVRTYPTLAESSGVSLFARGNEAKLVSLDAWQMRSIWPELEANEGK